jgi:hypothetical protein
MNISDIHNMVSELEIRVFSFHDYFSCTSKVFFCLKRNIFMIFLIELLLLISGLMKLS